MGAYGNKIVRTPNMDRLASQGMLFNNMYCASPLCVPSRMSFMTSCTPTSNRVWNNNHILSQGIPTWAHVLSAAGYETVLLGRMHFCGPDQRHGFESRPIAERNAGPVGMTPKGGPFWTKFPGSTSGQCRESVEIAGRGNTHYQWGDEEKTRISIKWLEHRAHSSETRPFAAVVGYTLPHCPYVAPRELFDYYYEHADIPKIEQNQPETIIRFRKLRGILDPPLDNERIRVARAAYYGLCEHIDNLMGQVLDAVENLGLAENTVVIYTSDHGEMAGEHGCWWKSNYYESSASVPMIVRWPGTIAPGSMNKSICSLMDIGPTLADFAGASFPYPVDGRSLRRILETGSDKTWLNETFSELSDMRGGNIPSRMIRSGPWKLWIYGDSAELPPALFNLDEDPGEIDDLGCKPEYEWIKKRLLEKIQKNWKPVEISAISKRQCEYFDLLASWGRATNPDAPDALVYPPAEFEDNVELL